MKRFSLAALFICLSIQIYFGHVFFQNYNEQFSNATIGWDVSGYYFYLPAIFIYKDLKQLNFKEEILQKYRPTPELQQAHLHSSGNYIMKYSAGQAITYLPWFGIAQLWANISEQYPPDGFSFPYQLMISLGSLFVSFLGLWILRKVLLNFFSDKATAATLISIVLGTNYLEFSTISGAMTHNSLFTLYAALLYSTIKFYKKPKLLWAISIGFIIGWMALIRPTEIIAALIPILWGLKGINLKHIFTQINFLKRNSLFLIIAIAITGLIGFIQLAYWKYAGGEWIIYSYQDQGFDWLTPHLREGIFGYQTGWLVYTPIMIFSLIGFVNLFRKKIAGSFAVLSFALIFIYLCFAWSEWLYGGSLSVRAMVQSYAILALPMTAFYQDIIESKKWKWAIAVLVIIFCTYNLWLHRHAHQGGLLHAGNMTKAYFWKILGKNKVDQSALKLLDTDEEFLEERKELKILLAEDFEQTEDSTCNEMKAISGEQSFCLNQENQFSPKFEQELEEEFDWLRISAQFRIEQKEWDIWKMTQLVVQANDGKREKIKLRSIRLQRLMNDTETKELFLDFSLPKQTKFIEFYFWNAGSNKPILIDNLILEGYNE